MNTNSTAKTLTINALAIAIVYVATAFINIKIPFMGNGGLIHLGNVPLFFIAITFGSRTGAIAGGIGMALFDLLSGWTIWAPFTLIIVGLMGYSVGHISNKTSFKYRMILSMLVALAIKLVGYYFAEVILYGNWLVPFGSIPGNIIQVGTAILIVLPLAASVKHFRAFLPNHS